MAAGKVSFLPVYHGRINFAKHTREKLESMQPDRIAIELPGDLQESMLTAIDRLPVLSIVGYMERDMMPRARIVKRHGNEQNPGPNPYQVVLHSQYTYIPIHPGDPMIEAIRFARQQGIPVEFIDLAVDDYDPVYHALPDDEAITLVRDPKRFNELILSFMPRSDPGSLDHDREQAMAARLRELVDRNERVLFISGYAHVNRIKHMLETGETGEASSGIYHDEQQVFNIHPDSVDLALEEIPYFEYLFEAWRSVIKEGLDPPTFASKITLGKFAFFQQEQRDRDVTVHTSGNASDQGGTVHGQESSMGTNHARTPSNGSAVDDKWIEVLKRITSHEIEQLQQRGFSRPFALSLLFQSANMIYEQYYQRERVPATIFTPMMQYLRNWTLIRDNLIPTLDQVAITAKNFVNEEYASIVLDLARMYPFPDSSGRFPTLRHQGSRGLGDGDRIFLKSRLGRKPRSWMQLPIRHHPKERFPGEWKRAWGDQPHGLYSYPPEDVIEESFFDHLRQKTLSLLQERRVRVREFTSSLLDGIDIRETIRHLALQKIFVRESYPLRGKVGSVVIIFSDDDETTMDENVAGSKDGNARKHGAAGAGNMMEREERFPNKVTWWAEHDQESDMAFYGTPPNKNLIGPGIARIELGGVLSIYPPRGIPNVWTYFEPVAGMFTKAEILMLAAVEFCREPYIPVVSKQPPSKRLEAIAGRHGKTFIHVAIWTLSKEALADVRFVHVLRNKRVRQYASEYIFL